MAKEAVVFIFPNETHESVFMEERNPNQSQPGVRLFPGGHIESWDAGDNYEEVKISALRREIMEELDVTPTSVEALKIEPPATSPAGTILHPYIVHEFEGELPAQIKDSGNPTVWESIENALLSQSESVRVISGALINFYANLEG